MDAKFVDGFPEQNTIQGTSLGTACGKTNRVALPDLDHLLVGTEHHAVTSHGAPALYPHYVLKRQAVTLIFRRERAGGAHVVQQSVTRRGPDGVREPVRARRQRSDRKRRRRRGRRT